MRIAVFSNFSNPILINFRLAVKIYFRFVHEVVTDYSPDVKQIAPSLMLEILEKTLDSSILGVLKTNKTTLFCLFQCIMPIYMCT